MFPLALALVSLAACGGTDRATSEMTTDRVSDGLTAASFAPTTAAAAALSTAAATTAAPAASGAKSADAPTSFGLPTQFPEGRKIAMTAGVDIEVASVSDASIKATLMVEAAGGYVAKQQTDLGAQPISTLVLKVPPSNLSGVMEQFGRLGTVLARTQNSDDLTAQYVDLEGRIVAAQQSVARVTDLMNRTGSLAEQAMVEGELTRRQTELEQLLGQKRLVENRTDVATLTLTLKPIPKVEARVTVPTPEPEPVPDTLPGWKRIGKDSVKLLATALYIAALAIVAIAPWALMASMVLGPVWLVVRRRRRAANALRVEQRLNEPVGPDRERIDA